MDSNYFYHENNIIGKINSNYKGKVGELKKLLEKYNKYKEEQLSIKGLNKKSIQRKIDLLEKYYKFVEKFIEKNGITSQSKLRPTILEEFCGLLFKDLSQIDSLKLGFFNRRIYAGIEINKDGKVTIKRKDVDFCIGKRIKANFDDETFNIIIPIIAIECKTYLDNTMFSEAQFTAQKIKKGAPNVKVYVVSEENQVGLNQIPSQTPVNQVFILRKNRTSEIDLETVWDFFEEIKYNLKDLKEGKITELPGRLLPG
tara:strand:- start:623 stop:1390 length:768 start_codon:yes stop_codon:yes gene_type:complete